MVSDMSAPASVTGKLKYLSADSESPAFHIGEPGQDSKWIGTYEEYDVEIHNGRKDRDTPYFAGQGFELIDHGTTDVDFASDEAIVADYYPQVIELFRERLGASEVLIFDHTVRTDAGTEGVRKPARHVHNDYTAASTIQRVIDIVGGDDAVARLRNRFAQVNLWRPIETPVFTSPLAVADAQSVAREDFVKADIIYSDRRGEVYEVLHKDTHRWFYFPEMKPHEAILFRGFDSAEDVSHPFTPHTAFDDPTSLSSTAPRKSIELRAMAFFD